MKKTYLTPALELLSAETEQMLATSISTLGIFDEEISDPTQVLAPEGDLDGFFSADQDLDSYFD